MLNLNTASMNNMNLKMAFRENNRLFSVFALSLAFIFLSMFGVQLSYADSTYTAAGDWGCTSNTDATVSNMANKGPEHVFALGDYSYQSTGTCWFNKIGSIDDNMHIAIGNHEDDDSEGFSGYMSKFSLSQTYYSFNHEDAHVLVVDTDRNSYGSGSAQRTFVQNDLQSASTNPSVKWIILYLHKPLYTSPNECSSSSCSNTGSENTNIRNWLGPLIDQYGVDLVLEGHVHNYQRSYQLKYDAGSPSSPTIGSNNANTYTEGNGAVYAIVGTGGVNFHALSGKASFTSVQQDDFFGQLQVKITNSGNKLEGTFYRNGNNAVLDSFSITKAVNSPPVANNQAINVIKNTATPVTLTATDPNNNPLTYTIVSQPAHGGVTPTTINGPPGRTYTPTTDYTGPDSFTFKANDGTLDSNIATVNINVIEQPQGGYNYAPSFVATGSSFNDTPDSASLRLNQFTVASWFKTTTNFGSDAYIINKGGVGSDSAGQNLNYGIWINSAEQIKAGFETSSGADQFVTSPNSYNDGQWHYAVVTNNGANLILYIDGTQVAIKATSGASPESIGTKPVRVGANSRVTPPTNFFTGEIDEVRIWNSALTSSQVSSAFGGTFAPGTVLYLPFGAGGGGGYNYAPGLVLTGSNSQDANSPSLSQFSLASWFKTTTNFGSDAYIADKGGVGSDTAGQNLNYGIWMTSTEQIKAGFETSTGADQYVTSPNTYNDGQWHYAVVTNSGTNVVLYIDGVQVASKATSGASPEQNTKPFRVGANARVDPPTNFFTGEVDEIRVWNDDLTAQEVSNAFAGTNFNTGDQVLYLDFTSMSLTGTYNFEPNLSLSGPGP